VYISNIINIKSTKIQREKFTWEEFCDVCRYPRVGAKNGKAYCPALCRGGRKDINVKAIYLLVMDLDDIDEDYFVNEIFPKIQKYEWILHTTYKHTDDVPRYRIILKPNRTIKPAEYDSVWQNVYRNLFNSKPDSTCKSLSHFYFYPVIKTKSSLFDFIYNKGVFLDPENFLSPIKTKSPTKAPINHVKSNLKSVLIKKIKKRIPRMKEDDQILWGLILNGEPIADEGERNSIMVRLTYQAAKIFEDRDPGAILDLFESSIKAMQTSESIHNKAPTLDQCYVMLCTAQDKIHEQMEAHDQVLREIQAAKIKVARTDGLDTPYSEDELKKIARYQSCTVNELQNRWIIYYGSSYYFLTLNGYIGPLSGDLPALADTFLSAAEISVSFWTSHGERLLSSQEILRRYGIPTIHVVANLNLEKSYFNLSKMTLYEATARRLVKLRPRFTKKIDEWLKIFGGESYEKLLDWMACAPDTNKILSGLCIYGGAGAGKTFLAHGIASLWSDGVPSDIAEIFGQFNERYSKNPVILADEYIPQNYGKSVTGDIRALIGTKSFTVRRKRKPTIDLHGAPRLFITSNDQTVLNIDEAIGRESLEAIARRLLYIHVNKKAADFLETLLFEEREAWKERKIAEHCLWLQANRKVIPGKRFFVEGSMGPSIKQMIFGNRPTSLLCEWIVNMLVSPTRGILEGKGNIPLYQYIKVYKGALYVNNTIVGERWETFLPRERPLSSSQIGKALASLSSQNNATLLRTNNKRRRYWKIDMDLIVQWAIVHNICDTNDILLAIKKLAGKIKIDGEIQQRSPTKKEKVVDLGRYQQRG
jgi:hypothetical protein